MKWVEGACCCYRMGEIRVLSGMERLKGLSPCQVMLFGNLDEETISAEQCLLNGCILSLELSELLMGLPRLTRQRTTITR